MKILVGILFSFLFLSTSCFQKVKKEDGYKAESEIVQEQFSYNIPDESFELDKELVEISGLAYSTFSDALVTINDEKGRIYYLNESNGEIVKEVPFGKAGDYEGIATHDSKIYVVESNGNIKVIDEESSKKVDEYNGVLSRRNDVEGLAHNPISNSILLAAKANSKTSGNDASQKAIFTMDIDNGKIDEDAFLVISIADLMEQAPMNTSQDSTRINRERRKRIEIFAPSGIAVHPVSNDIYILSSKGKSLVVLSQSGEVKSITFLDRNIHAQPEGICFDSVGNMYISNEGKSKKAKIHKYFNR